SAFNWEFSRRASHRLPAQEYHLGRLVARLPDQRRLARLGRIACVQREVANRVRQRFAELPLEQLEGLEAFPPDVATAFFLEQGAKGPEHRVYKARGHSVLRLLAGEHQLSLALPVVGRHSCQLPELTAHNDTA